MDVILESEPINIPDARANHGLVAAVPREGRVRKPTYAYKMRIKSLEKQNGFKQFFRKTRSSFEKKHFILLL